MDLTGAPHGLARHCHSISARSPRVLILGSGLQLRARLRSSFSSPIPPPDHLAAFVNVYRSSYTRADPHLSLACFLPRWKRQLCSSFPTASVAYQRSQPASHAESIESGLGIFLYLRSFPLYPRRRLASRHQASMMPHLEEPYDSDLALEESSHRLKHPLENGGLRGCRWRASDLNGL